MLKVYLSNTLVYSSNSLSLKMPPPFNAYLEVETSVSNATMWAKYTNYYDTLNDTLVVQNVPAGDTAKLLGAGNIALGSGTAGANGTATIKNLGQYDMPISASLEVLGPNSTVLATTGPSSFWGGDIYAFSGVATTTTGTSTVTVTQTIISTVSASGSTTTVTAPGNTTTVTLTGPTTTVTAPGSTDHRDRSGQHDHCHTDRPHDDRDRSGQHDDRYERRADHDDDPDEHGHTDLGRPLP